MADKFVCMVRILRNLWKFNEKVVKQRGERYLKMRQGEAKAQSAEILPGIYELMPAKAWDCLYCLNSVLHDQQF
jgi:hypothetical protein